VKPFESTSTGPIFGALATVSTIALPELGAESPAALAAVVSPPPLPP
jgi:hypothetical protein